MSNEENKEDVMSAPYGPEFYESCAKMNQVHDSPEQIRAWRVGVARDLELFGYTGSVNSLLAVLRHTIVEARAMESGYGHMSPFAFIHNLHVGLSEVVASVETQEE